MLNWCRFDDIAYATMTKTTERLKIWWSPTLGVCYHKAHTLNGEAPRKVTRGGKQFDEWWSIWSISGKWDQRGRCRGACSFSIVLMFTSCLMSNGNVEIRIWEQRVDNARDTKS